jgi:hypothetical protein
MSYQSILSIDAILILTLYLAQSLEVLFCEMFNIEKGFYLY